MKNVILAILAVAALGGAVYLIATRQDNVSDDPRESLSQVQVWICRSCKTDFSMTKQQWMNAANAGTLGCPQCGSTEMANAVYCPNVECHKAIETIGHGRLPSTCPHCNLDLGEWRAIDGQLVAPPTP